MVCLEENVFGKLKLLRSIFDELFLSWLLY